MLYLQTMIQKILISTFIIPFFFGGIPIAQELSSTMYTNNQNAEILYLPRASSIFSVEAQVADGEFFRQVNPFRIGRQHQPFAGADGDPDTELTTVGGFITRAMTFAFPIAIGIVFIMLIWAGFQIVAGASNKNSLEAGKKRATMAIAGLLLLFISYWIVNIIETIFGIVIISF